MRLGHGAELARPCLRGRVLQACRRPLGGYPARLADPALDRTLRGYLSGSLDLVLRVGAGDRSRFVVCDYKTNCGSSVQDSDGTIHPERCRCSIITSYGCPGDPPGDLPTPLFCRPPS